MCERVIIVTVLQVFGCDNTYGTTIKQRDGCGVCGGTNYTCDVFEGVFSEDLTNGKYPLPNKVHTTQDTVSMSLQRQYVETVFIRSCSSKQPHIIITLQ